MIDIHCHILPGIDDGAKTSGDTLTMLKSAIDEGITTITATPHHNPQFNNESPLILKKVKEVQNIIDEHQLPIEVLPGQEVRIYGDLLKEFSEGKLLTAAGTSSYILIEFPSNHVPAYAKELFYNIQLEGLQPILVHPERNSGIIENPDILFDFIEQGVLSQITDVGGGQVGNPDAAGTSSVMVIKAKSGTHKGGGYKTPIKASGQGDSPVNVTFTLPYENASVSGTTVTNNWANYSMNLGRQVQVENTGSGTDWFVEDENAVLINSYIALDKYTAGNTSLDSFISSYMADTRGFKNSSRDGSVNLGAYSFVRLTRTVKTPYGDMYDHAYIRQIEGTNFAQVLVVEQNGDNQDFMGALQTIARVR